MEKMKLTFRLLCVIALLIIFAHRLPAPIQEVPESPTPAATIVPTAVPAQHSTATPVAVAGPDSTAAARFAGTWTGKINMEKLGAVDVTLIISADGTSVQQGSRMGNAQYPLTYDRKMLCGERERKTTSRGRSR